MYGRRTARWNENVSGARGFRVTLMAQRICRVSEGLVPGCRLITYTDTEAEAGRGVVSWGSSTNYVILERGLGGTLKQLGVSWFQLGKL